MAEEIVVEELSVKVVTGETVYRYENGFSAIVAHTIVSDSAAVTALREAVAREAKVIVRCANLDVAGTVQEEKDDGGKRRFSLRVEDISYHKPESKLIVEHKPRTPRP